MRSSRRAFSEGVFGQIGAAVRALEGTDVSDKKTDLALDAATMALDATTASTGVPAGSFARLGTTLISGLITRYDQKSTI